MAKILVVDDEPTVLQAFEALLSARGHEVLITGDAEEALHRLESTTAIWWFWTSACRR